MGPESVIWWVCSRCVFAMRSLCDRSGSRVVLMMGAYGPINTTRSVMGACLLSPR